MTLSTSSVISSGNSSSADELPSEIQIALLKKAQDQMKQQGEALIKMIDQNSAVSESGKLDAYA